LRKLGFIAVGLCYCSDPCIEADKKKRKKEANIVEFTPKKTKNKKTKKSKNFQISLSKYGEILPEKIQ